MDGVFFKSWFETVFLRAVRARTNLPVALISDNCGAHEELESEQVTFIPLPPNCTSVYQPLDLGIIACLKRRYKRRLLDLVVGAFDLNIRNRAVVAASPTAASANAAAATVDAQRPTADASTGGGPANARPSGVPSVAASGAARTAASIDRGPRGALTAAVTAPPSAKVAPVSGPTTAAESGPTLGVGRWLSADGSWPTIESNASRRPADAAHLAIGRTAERGADGRAARHAVLPAADEAPRRADGGVAGRVANPLATSPEEAAAVGARAADLVATAVEATGPQRLISGPDPGMDGGLRRAGRSAPSEGM